MSNRPKAGLGLDVSRGPFNVAAWLQEAGSLVDRIDHDDFPKQLGASLGSAVPLDMVAIFVYRGRSRPLCVHDTFPDEAQDGLSNYVEGSYVLNPCYQAHLRGLDEGVYRIGELAPDAYFESENVRAFRAAPRASEEIGYVTDSWPTGFEEVMIAVRIAPEITGDLGLYRAAARGGFSDRHLSDLRSLQPLVSSAFRKYWGLRSHEVAARPLDSRIDELFEDFGKPVLSDREREVIRMVLRGHSSNSIGLNLDISVTTVKTHRKRAYAKLGIATQSELLSLFLDSIGKSPG